MTGYFARWHRLGHTVPRVAVDDVAVGVPVHNSLDDVVACLTSVIATSSRSTRVIVVDDGSADPTRDWCRRFAEEHDRVTLVRHDEARGYTRAANVILQESDAEATVLLNSDTVVTGSWLERLVTTARSAPDVGLVGPLSNAASWQSVPDLYASRERKDFAVNELPARWTPDDMAVVVGATPSTVVPRVPLLNGFCTLIRRAVIDEVGYLDDVLFPMGYGEENDFAFRVSDAGFALALATDTYVFHAKSRSFTHEVRRELSAAGSKAFRTKWPKRRIDDAIRTMRDHPVLIEKRRIVRHVQDAIHAGSLPRVLADGLPPGVRAAMEATGMAVESTNDCGADDQLFGLSWRTSGEAAVVAGDDSAELRIRVGRAGHPLSDGTDAIDLGEEADQQVRRLTALLTLGTVPGLHPPGAGDDPRPTSSAISAPAGPIPSGTSLLARTVNMLGVLLGADADLPGRDPFLRKFDASTTAVAANRRVVDAFRSDPRPDLSRVTWFVPRFEHVLRGGLHTIFATADHLESELGTQNVFVLCGDDHADVGDTERHVKSHFPDLHAEFHSFRFGDDPAALPASGTGVCTLWTTAYVLMHYNRCSAKFYFVQDWEPSFYAAGTRSALIEQTYRLGFALLANSPGVAERCVAYDDLVGMFRPGVDMSLFHPPAGGARRGGKDQVVFYGRPGNARNGFDLGADALVRVKKQLGRKVEIISAGAEWDPASQGLGKVVRNLGVLRSMDEVAELYRRSTVGLVFMFTAHPSYQPLEYMASGCATVTNFNPSNAWLLRDGENCRIAPTTSTGVAETVLEVLEDDALRDRIVKGGYKAVAALRWEDAFDSIRSFLTDPAAHRWVPPVSSDVGRF